jgi:hypothetical protein
MRIERADPAADDRARHADAAIAAFELDFDVGAWPERPRGLEQGAAGAQIDDVDAVTGANAGGPAARP